MSDHSVYCPSKLTSHCAEGVYYDDHIADLGVNDVQHAIDVLASSGVQGAQGAQGNSIQGPQGSQGSQGPQGSQGTVGPQGPAGSGSQGPQGAQGNSIQGPQGSQGPQGVGSQGPQGPAGTDFSSFGFFALKDSPQVIAVNTDVYVTFAAGATGGANNPGGVFNGSDSFTAPVDSYYDFSASVLWNLASGDLYATMTRIPAAGTSTDLSYSRVEANTTTVGIGQSLSACHVFMQASDSVMVSVRQTGGTAGTAIITGSFGGTRVG